MRGPVNAPITLTIVRKGVDDPFDVKVTRDVIHINPVKYNAEGDDSAISGSPPSTSKPRPILQKAVEDLKQQLGPKLRAMSSTAQQPRRSARPGDLCVGCVPR